MEEHDAHIAQEQGPKQELELPVDGGPERDAHANDEDLNKAFNYAFVIIPLAVALVLIAAGFLYAACTGGFA